jgi:hypothetical protein
MNIQDIKSLQKICLEISKIKEEIIDELPHYGHQALYLNNDEITTGLLDNKIEIKIHLLTGELQFYNNESVHTIDLVTDNITEELNKITKQYGLKGTEEKLEHVEYLNLVNYHSYATTAKQILEMFRMNLKGKVTLIHLWPHHFDFSVEWFTGNTDQQIGVGISPGDDTNPDSYLYMNPYPFNEEIRKEKLPIGVWHVEEWKGVKIDYDTLLKYTAFETGKKLYDLFKVVKTNFD